MVELADDITLCDIPFANKIDLTGSGIILFDTHRTFYHLRTLIIDRNGLSCIGSLPHIPTLTSLSCDSNMISDLRTFLQDAYRKFPNLVNLSVKNNPCVPSMKHKIITAGLYLHRRSKLLEGHVSPNYFAVGDNVLENDEAVLSPNWAWPIHERLRSGAYGKLKGGTELMALEVLYRLAVLTILPNLVSLDAREISEEESRQSVKPWAGTFIRLKYVNYDDIEEDCDARGGRVGGGVLSGGNHEAMAVLRARRRNREKRHISSGAVGWRWPEDYVPPEDIVGDTEKMTMLATVQKELDDFAVGPGGFDFRAAARATCWEINNKTLCRYLGAAFWKYDLNGVPVSKAVLETVRWRAAYKLPIRNLEAMEAALHTGFAYVSGVSRDGKPLIHLTPRLRRGIDIEAAKRVLIYTVERAIQSMRGQIEQYAVIVDCVDLGFQDLPSLSHLAELAGILGKHMGRRLSEIYVLNVSPLVHTAYSMISMFMNQVTRNKFCFVSGGKSEIVAALSRSIDYEYIPTRHGGGYDVQFRMKEYLDEDPYMSTKRDMENYNRLYS